VIPPLVDDTGYLPPGIHLATLDEIAETFGGGSPERRELMQSLRWLVDMCKRDDVDRLIVNGSFVTSKLDPGDVDCVLLGGKTFGNHGISIHEWRMPLPFIHLEIGDAIIFDAYVTEIFGADLDLKPKGVIEVQL
jgi:hypothetical protein